MTPKSIERMFPYHRRRLVLVFLLILGYSTSEAFAQSAGFSQDCNLNGIPDSTDLELNPADDCNKNQIPDECDILPFRLLESSLPPAPFPVIYTTAGDVDSDGFIDIVGMSSFRGSREIAVWYGTAPGVFSAPVIYSAANPIGTLVLPQVVDMNHDGRNDITYLTENLFGVLTNQGGRQLVASSPATLERPSNALNSFAHTIDLNDRWIS